MSMLATLEAVVRRLVEAYDPERIILFGSRARNTGASDADYDLLVVKDTTRRPLDRRMEVERVLADRAVALDLTVYTPNEMRGLYAQGSPFITDVLATGKVLYMRDATKASSPWCKFSGADKLVAVLRSALLGGSRDPGPAHSQAAPRPSKGRAESHSSVTGPGPDVESPPPSGRREP